MKTIYHLSIDGKVFYVGQTSYLLHIRLNGHFSLHPEIKNYPQWLKKMIKITAIEDVPIGRAGIREAHWIRHYKALGCELLNKNKCATKPLPAPKHQYKLLTDDEVKLIYSHNYYIIAARLNITSERVRQCLKSKRIKKSYYDIIFTDLITQDQSVNDNLQ